MNAPAHPRAVVTGGTGAIGTAICRSLAQAGMQVCAIGHPSETERIAEWQRTQRNDGFEFSVVLADLAERDAATSAMHDASAQLGGIDVLINAAGITRDARFTKMTADAWRAVMGSNLDSVFHCTQVAFAGMSERGFGRIVNISSVNGQRGQFGQTNYSAAKAGMHGFTMALAQEGARHGITVNTVSPGYVRTPMTASIKPEVLQGIVAQVPMGRMAEAEEIARVVVFLCAAESGYITGANIPVNGGLFMSF